MTTTADKRIPFAVKDCALAAIGTGERAQNLRELRNGIATVHPGSVYYHFWGGLLRPRFDDREYHNDFAIWARHGLHDNVLAERLSVIDPAVFHDIEDLRQELVDIIEERLDESEFVPWAKRERQYYFIRSSIVVFDTHHRIKRPKDLPSAIEQMSPSSIFYHFIDARRRTEQGVDDFCAWLFGFEKTYRPLCDLIGTLDPFFNSLIELKQRLSAMTRRYFKGKKS